MKSQIPTPPPQAALRTGSLRFRATLAVLLLLVVLLSALAVTVEVTLGTRLRAQIEDRLRDRASAATALVGTVSSDNLAQRLSFQGVSVLIRDKDGGSVTAGPTPAQLKAGPKADARLPGSKGDPANRPTVTSGASSASNASPKTTKSKTITITSSRITTDDQIVTLVSHLSDKTTITLTADASSVDETLAQLRWVMLGASGGFLLVAAAGLVLVMRVSLRPLDRMSAVARSIAGGDRGRRLVPARPQTEIGRVAVAFDEMLDAVEGAEGKALEAEARVRAFVSDAAHELRTPIGGMRAAADTLVRARLDGAEREGLASHVVREAGRASRLIDDMLMMARVDQGLQLHLTPVDLTALVEAEAERHRLRRPNLALRTHVPDISFWVSGDGDRLAQVISNLIDNSARATGGTGDVSLTVESQSNTTVALIVADDGPGVPEADRERIFDRLVRLDPGRDLMSGGAGLGLPIARGIARAHHGDIVCTPSEHGAVFELTLPVPVTVTPATVSEPDGDDSRPRRELNDVYKHSCSLETARGPA